MPEKDTSLWTTWLPWVSTLVLSLFATLAQYAAKIRDGNEWSWRALALDGVICVFVGVVTHLLCTWSGVDGVGRSVLVAISAHMGTRSMMQYEKIRDRVFGIKD